MEVEEYKRSMTHHRQVYSVEDGSVDILTSDSRNHFVEIFSHMLSLREIKAPLLYKLLAKFTIIFNEVTSNIYKYEKSNAFAFSLNHDKSARHIYIHFLIKDGDGLDEKEIKDNIKYLESIEGTDEFFSFGGRGYYNCAKASDSFRICDIKNEKDFKKELIFMINTDDESVRTRIKKGSDNSEKVGSINPDVVNI